MKYRLIKDLPWAKAGTVFVEVDKDSYWKTETGVTLAADCYEAMRNYFVNEDTQEFEPDGKWFEPLEEESEEIKELEVDPYTYANVDYAQNRKINEIIKIVNKLKKD